MTSIAIVGLAGLFPEALTVAQFWDNIVRKRSCITEVPASRWRLEDYYDSDRGAPDKTYSRWGGFIPNVEFDPLEFGIPPNVLEVTDVAQLLSLLVAKQALEDAGYGDVSAKPFDRERTGVVLGVGGGQKLITPLTSRLQGPVWEEAMRSSGLSEGDAHAIAEKIKLAYVPWEENSFPGMLGNVIAGRIANRLDLGGINCVVDAACAGSLAALRVALAELEQGQADMLITGGVDTDNSIFMYMCFSKTPAFTPGDRIRPFDANSDGMMIGEATVMFVLKRLADAERDGDRIYAVIRGLGSSSDGRFSSIYAPRSEGQARALNRAYANAGVPLNTVSLIEAHGTGTVAGDLVEVTTLRKAFGEAQARPNQVALGSVKSQIGHTKSAAGASGLMKATLALHHRVLPPTINVEQPHPAGNFGHSELYLNTETRPWARLDPDTPRRAGVSSFGFGGSNFHVVLEEYGAEAEAAYRLNTAPSPVVLSAASPAELGERCRLAAQQLRSDGGTFTLLVRETISTAISGDRPRIGFIAETAEEAAGLLERAAEQLRRQPEASSWEHPEGIFYRRAAFPVEGALVALFPGQGSQYVNMGRELAANFPEVRQLLGKADALFLADGAPSLSGVVFPIPAFAEDERRQQEDALRQTEFAQPAIGVLSEAMFTLLRTAGFRPSFAAGHSFGELTALWAADVLSDEDFLTLARARGKAMTPLDEHAFDAGAMLSVVAGASDLEPLLADMDGVVLANVNSPRQTVLAGPTPAIVTAEATLTARGFKTTRLPVAAAFHSPLVAHGRAAFEVALREVAFDKPAIPVYANSTGQHYPEDVAEALSDQIVAPVRFEEDVESIYAAGGRVFVEIGPRGILTNLVHDVLGDREHVALALNPRREGDSDRQLRLAMVHLAVLGVPLNLADPHAREMPRSTAKRSPATVLLNGANYVSEKTRQAYVNALNDGHQIEATPAPSAPVVSAPASSVALTSEPATSAQAVSAASEELIELHSEQAASAALHQQFLADQAEQTRVFLGLLAKQQDLLLQPSVTPAALESVSASLGLFQSVQAETVRAHQRYLELAADQFGAGRAVAGARPPRAATGFPLSTMPPPRSVAPTPRLDQPLSLPPASDAPGPSSTQRRLSTPAVAAPASPAFGAVERAVPEAQTPTPTMQQAMPAAQTPAPASVPAAPALADASAPSIERVTEELLQVVSAKTGYPADTLELDMQIEADLGIDSIKRVEILGEMRERFPNAPALKPAELAELRTLGQIIEYLSQQSEGEHAPHIPILVEANAGYEAAAVKDALLEVVSAKTGYPPDTLELDMDIEADLGIDSIKRVEILAAMREQFPNAPALKPAELAELRILQHVLDYVARAAEAPIEAEAATPQEKSSVKVLGIRLKPLP
ncbi:MAG: acyltransferase domain-containing protein, partial [Chloroflexi bacterium]|nr:acyltransferase domain-containing protein [Chloroflexota bacterium]